MQNDSTEPACLICGAPLRYLECAREMTCAICGKICLSNAECIHGHFVCDDCHSTPAAVVIRSIALAASEKDPFVIATAMMKSPAVHMHGPEHHILAGASLLAAYRNAGGELDLPHSSRGDASPRYNDPGWILRTCRNLWGCDQRRDVLLHCNENKSPEQRNLERCPATNCSMSYCNWQSRRAALL